MAYYRYKEWEIPDYMADSIRAYLYSGAKPSGFLLAVLCNNFTDVVRRADETNLANLPAYVHWLNSVIPLGAWGSLEKVEEWMEARRNLIKEDG